MASLQAPLRRLFRKSTAAFALVAVSLVVYLRHSYYGGGIRYKSTNTLDTSWKAITYDNEAGQYCATKSLQFYPGRKSRKVYDLFMMSHELDLLEIRLHTLEPWVDYFVIVESSKTFTGHDKPLLMKENWDKFAQFHKKIIYREVEYPGDTVGPRIWDKEDYYRNSMFHAVFPSIVDTEQAATFGDVLMVSDLDEIPKPDTIQTLRNCHTPDRVTIRSHMYYYSYQWLHRGRQWAHPQATVYKGLTDTILPKDLRNGEGGTGWGPVKVWNRWWQKADLWDAAWHCSSCFATIKEMQTKMDSFSHQPWNTPENRDAKTMVDRVRTGKDLFGRFLQNYDRIEWNEDVPPYILQNEQRFMYLLDRDGEDGAFTDYAEVVLGKSPDDPEAKPKQRTRVKPGTKPVEEPHV